MKDRAMEVSPIQRPQFWKSRNLARGFAAWGVVAGVVTGTWAVEEAAKSANPGLSGIVSAALPENLSAEEFAKLDGNWAEWSAGAAAAVADFYAKLEGSDVKAQRAALDGLRRKLDVMQRAIDDPKYASLLEPLQLLHGRLSRRLEIADATLDTLEMDPQAAKAANVKKSSQAVVAAVGGLETYLKGINQGGPWLSYVKGDAVRTALAKGADNDEAVAAAKLGKEKIAGRAALAAEDQKQFLGRPAFLAYEAAVDQYLAAVAWQPPADAGNQLRTQLKSLFEAIDSYADSRTKEDAAKARVAFVEIRKVAPDAGERMSAVLQKYHFNYNTRIVASEEFLNRLMSDARTEQGAVVDNVLGAAVSGQQTTSTTVGVDLRPSPNTARFDLALKGTIRSNTVGVTSEATVQTSGNHSFYAAKPISFDGQKFTTSPATISVNPHNTTTGISTNVGGLFSGIANRIASQEVEARRGQAEAIAASRIEERVLPRFNSEADKSFADASAKMEKELFSGLRATGLYPDAITYQTTDTVLRVNSRLMATGELGADLPHPGLISKSGATALMHETAINNSIDRLELAGQTLNDAELKAKVESFLSKALNREIKFKAEAKPASDDGEETKSLSAIMFAPTDPMRVRIENGELVLVIRAGFKQEGKDDIPLREIEAPILFEVKGKEILATRGNVTVSTADGEGGGIAINGVIRKKIQSALPDRTFDGKVEFKGPSKTVVAHISRIKLADGWIAITVN